MISLRYQLLSLTTKAKNLSLNSDPLFPGGPPGLASVVLAFHHTIVDGFRQYPLKRFRRKKKFNDCRAFDSTSGLEALGCGESFRLVCTPRLSVALSSPLKMSTKALAAIAKVKSEHILKVT